MAKKGTTTAPTRTSGSPAGKRGTAKQGKAAVKHRSGNRAAAATSTTASTLAIKPKISIIIPVYNEALNAPLLYHEIVRHIKDLPYEFEFIYVDDGSKDFSSEAIEKLIRHHSDVRLIQFSRNFGKEAAISAGLHTAAEHGSDAALMLDADFQHPPKLIKAFIAKWQDGADVIIGVRKSSKSEGWFKRFTSDLFYALIKPIANTDLIPHATDFRLLERKVIEAFGKLSEHDRMTRGLIDWLGFNRDFVHFHADPRKHGTASYSYRKLIELAIRSFTSYTMLPLRLAGYVGAITTAIIGPVTLFLYLETYAFDDPMHLGITNLTLISLLLVFLVGIVLGCIGLVALYIAHIHAEVINRPLYVVRKHVRNGHPELTPDTTLQRFPEPLTASERSTTGGLATEAGE